MTTNLVSVPTKLCNICDTEQPVESMYGRRCRPCRNLLSRERAKVDPAYAEMRRNSVKNWAKNNPEDAWKAYRKNQLKKYDGMTVEDYDALFAKQKGLCAICKEPETWTHSNITKVTSLSVDHDHDTGKIRGLLCKNCNQSLGKFKDNADLLYAAYEYLLAHKESM